jgi:predicted O-methyltransferase YrrM
MPPVPVFNTIRDSVTADDGATHAYVSNVEQVRFRDLTQALARNLYRRNRSRIRERLGKERDAPWMRPQEEDIVREVLRRLQPLRCLEWGSGMSTLQFPGLLPADSRWLSIEHDRHWADVVRRANPRPNVATAHVPADIPEWNGEDPARTFASYLRYPAAYGPYDFILVDGRARVAAIETAISLVAEGGVVILHDANRAAYAEVCRPFPFQVAFQDSRARTRRPSGGIWVGSFTRPVHHVLDVALHQRIWHFYSGIGRPLA